MQVCANCGHTNRPGVLFCENCGTSLTGKAAVGTTKSFEEGNAFSTGPLSAAGTDYFMPNATLRVEIEGGPEPVLIKPKQELIFGRRDPATGAMPDIDLTPYAGYRMGVSRRHAAIRSADESHLDIWDLGSSNGTFLNGQRLNAHRPYRLRDGDRLRLGQMIIRVFFQPPDESAINATGEHAATDTPGPDVVEELPVAEKDFPSLAEILSETGHSEPIDPAKAAKAAQPAEEPAEPPPSEETEILPEMSSTASLTAPSEEDKKAAAAMFAAEEPSEEAPPANAPKTIFPIPDEESSSEDEAPDEAPESEDEPPEDEAPASEDEPPDEPAS
jgi:pSer/pThr/pTyr-binding forkhead associated (FHA) protein